MDLAGGSAVSTSLAIEKLVSLLTGESKLLKGVVTDEVHSLTHELEHLRAFLEDADARSASGESMKLWLKQIKEVAELIEDVVDEHILKVSQRLRHRGFISFLGKAGRLIGTLNSSRNLASNIQNIKALLVEIKEKGRRYNLVEHGLISSTKTRRSTIVERYHPRFVSPFLEECIVGFDSIGVELMEKLTEEGATRRSVVSIVGAGGMGKTTLAKKVYDDEVVRQHFDYRAWITVSQSRDIEELLRIMAKEICSVEQNTGEIDTMQFRELITTLSQSLHSKRYMLVFDDVWLKEFWQVMKLALPDDDNGSRIIITTRSENVVASCKDSSFNHVHKLEPLSKAMSWDLFCRIAFQHDPEFRCPPELEELALIFIRVCAGVPLTIIVVAGLLSTKEKLVSEWKRVLDSIRFQLQPDPDLVNISKILALSFSDLPSQLKLCFLYFSIFPEDSLIPNDKLFKLWIAEGFVQEQRGMTLEETAEEYLNELIHRNMVQACEGFYELEKFCRVHDLMHEIARQKAGEFSFCQIRDKYNSGFGRKIRRLSIYNNVENVLETIEDSQVRSVFLFNVGVLNNSFVVTLFERYKLLTLLDFENVPLAFLPNELGNLFHLKYLNLKNTKLKMLPKSVGNLLNLQTLDLRNTLLTELQTEINELQNLRHLLASGYDNEISLDSTQGVMIKEGIGCLKDLQTLMTVEAHHSGFGLIKELEKLTQLRRLGISRLTADVSSSLCCCIEEMSHLEYLSLESRDDGKIFNLETISAPPPFLQRLVLKGLLQNLPHWFSILQNLSMLCLSMSRLQYDPLECLSSLPNLVSLWLYRAYEGEELHFERGGFPKLKLLVLRELHGLKLVEIEVGALSCLEELRIGSSPLLKEVPFGVQHLMNLKVLANYDMPSEFVLSMQPDGGHEYWKVEHIPSVLFWYRVERRRYILYKLGEPELLDRLQGSATNINDIAERDMHLSFYYSEDDEDLASNNANQLSFSSDRLSLSSDRFSFFSDDIED